MQISGIQAQFATYSLNESNNIGTKEMEMLLAAGDQIKQAPMNTKLVNQANKSAEAVQNGSLDIYG